MDEFLSRRSKCFPSDFDEMSALPSIFWKLLVYEMLYLWNALPSCSLENIEKIKLGLLDFFFFDNIFLFVDCEQVSDFNQEPMLGLSKLILGCCYCIQRQYSMGIKNFRLCLEIRKDIANNAIDAHVSAFSQYELGALLIKTNDVSTIDQKLRFVQFFFTDSS